MRALIKLFSLIGLLVVPALSFANSSAGPFGMEGFDRATALVEAGMPRETAADDCTTLSDQDIEGLKVSSWNIYNTDGSLRGYSCWYVTVDPNSVNEDGFYINIHRLEIHTDMGTLVVKDTFSEAKYADEPSYLGEAPFSDGIPIMNSFGGKVSDESTGMFRNIAAKSGVVNYRSKHTLRPDGTFGYCHRCILFVLL